MRIAKVIIKDFQRHEHLELDLDPKLTAIIGPGDVGKSAILRAISWVLQGVPNSDALRRHYYEDDARVLTKQTGVKLTKDDGTTIERIRSKTINRYIVTKPDEDPVALNRFGRTIPQEVTDATSMKPIVIGDVTLFPYIQRQHDPYFLLSGMSGPGRWKALSALAGTEAADKTVASFNSQIQQLGKSINEIDAELVEDGKRLVEEETELQKRESLYARLHTIQEEVESLLKRKEHVSSLIHSLEETDTLLKRVDDRQGRFTSLSQTLGAILDGTVDAVSRHAKISGLHASYGVVVSDSALIINQLEVAQAIALIPVPSDLVERAAAIKRLISDGVRLNTDRKTLKAQRKSAQTVASIILPNLDIDRYHQLSSACGEASSWQIKRKACASSLKEAKAKTQNLHDELHDALVEAGTCPLCGVQAVRMTS
jgi:DNA repair exonuclease SbcCD ATPase subunit